MNAIERLLSCKGNPVEFFELVEAAKAEVEKLRAQTVNDAFVIHALRDVEGERDALMVSLNGICLITHDGNAITDNDARYRAFRVAANAIPEKKYGLMCEWDFERDQEKQAQEGGEK